MPEQATAPFDDPEVVECEYCRGPRRIDESIKAYCGRSCLYAAKGERILNRLDNDETVCSTCYTTVKVTHRPDEEQLIGKSEVIRDAFVGYQYATPEAREGDTVVNSVGEGVGVYPSPRPKIKPTLGCHCGTLDLREADDALAKSVGKRILENLYAQLLIRYNKGGVDDRPDWEELRDGALAGPPGHGLDYAVGRALYSD